MTKPKKIKPLDGFSNVSDADVVSRCTNIQTSMTNNPHFPNPPVDLAALKTAIDTFSALIAQALDGSKKVIAEKNKQREVVIKMVRLLGRYVEVFPTCRLIMVAGVFRNLLRLLQRRHGERIYP